MYRVWSKIAKNEILVNLEQLGVHKELGNVLETLRFASTLCVLIWPTIAPKIVRSKYRPFERYWLKIAEKCHFLGTFSGISVDLTNYMRVWSIF